MNPDHERPHELQAIATSAQALEAAREELNAAVSRAREAGHSYAKIAGVLGVSRQAAWERFHHVERAGAEKAPS